MEAKIVLGIETSCDDTSVCLLKTATHKDDFSQILFHRSYSQEEELRVWGGVVPEIAARNHLFKLTPLIESAFKETSLDLKQVDLISVTTHPGLLGPLLTGLNAAKTLCLMAKRPLFPVNHLFAHLEAIHLTEKVSYPYLGLIVSGGHTAFFQVSSPSDFTLIGSTIDDAAGEAFDKGGKLMGLGYPAGKIIDELAAKGDPKRYHFPIGLEGVKKPIFSFSGLKTSLRVFLEENPTIRPHSLGTYPSEFLDLCASYQQAIIKALVKKTALAINLMGGQLPLVVGGGVACNRGLRLALQARFSKVFFVKPAYCTDNGAMVANYGALNFNHRLNFPDCLSVDAASRFIEKKGTYTHV